MELDLSTNAWYILVSWILIYLRGMHRVRVNLLKIKKNIFPLIKHESKDYEVC